MRRINRLLENQENLDHEGSWAISYGDMVTLLLAFFILFFSIKTPEKVMKEISLSLEEKLKELSGNNLVYEEKRIEYPQSKELPLDLGLSDPANMSSMLELRSKPFHSISDDLSYLKMPVPPVLVEKKGRRLVITYPGISFFSSASTKVLPEGVDALKEFTKKYTPFAGSSIVNIIGYSDHRPVKNKHRFRDNLELSVLRAVSAQRILQHLGIPMSRMRLMGFGTIDPASRSDLDRERALALSRKIVLVIDPELEVE